MSRTIRRLASTNSGGAMKRRLEQLAEEAPVSKDDPKAGGRDTNQLIEEMYQRIQATTPSRIYHKELAYDKIPKAAPKSVFDHAQGEVWTGKETPEQLANRMAVDKLQQKTIKLPSFKKPTNLERMSDAREKSLDYKLDKKAPKPDATDQEKMVEKFMMGGGGSSGAHGALGVVNSIANQRIEDAVQRGQFKNLPRGQKSETDHHTSSPYIDTTEYFLNRMIKRQGAMPPWVEQQTKVYYTIDQMRLKLKTSWVKYMVTKLDNDTKGMSLKTKLKEAKSRVDLGDPGWHENHKTYHELLIKDVNDTIRGYNLQAPNSARKGYIDLDDELQLCYGVSRDAVLKEFGAHINAPQEPPPKTQSLQSKSRNDLVSENPDNHYGLSHLIRDLFKRRVPK